MPTSTALLPISVVVPVRDEAAVLPELFAGLLRQTAKPAQIVFVDTGSTDGSPAAIEAGFRAAGEFGIGCSLVRLDRGYPGAARNEGIRTATQSWIAFIDAGITPDEDWLEALWSCRESLGKEALYGVCRFSAEDLLGRVLCALSYGQGRTAPVLPASLFRRDVFERSGYFEPSLRSGEDILWKQALAQAGVSIGVCQRAVVNYRHFPPTLARAARKWYAYERSASAAGLGGGPRAAVLYGLILLAVCLPILPCLSAAGLVLYALARGVLDPLRRSGWQPWWGPQPLAILAAPPVAAVLDFSSAVGRLDTLLRGRRLERA